MPILKYHAAAILLMATVCGRELEAKEKQVKAEARKAPQDQIVVEAHLAVTGAPITRFVATRHYERSYIYAERGTGKEVTLFDITNPSSPQLLSDVKYPEGTKSAELLAVAGTAVLTGENAATTVPPVQTISLMDFSDPANPRVTRQFGGVTAVERIGSIILLANADGIWILSQHLAEDPEAQRRYLDKVIYGER